MVRSPCRRSLPGLRRAHRDHGRRGRHLRSHDSYRRLDALQEGVHAGEGPLAALKIVLKANGAAVECTAKDENGEPAPGAHVLVLPDAPRRQQAALFGECRTKADGTCKILGITPGEYHVFAFPERNGDRSPRSGCAAAVREILRGRQSRRGRAQVREPEDAEGRVMVVMPQPCDAAPVSRSSLTTSAGSAAIRSPSEDSSRNRRSYRSVAPDAMLYRQ